MSRINDKKAEAKIQAICCVIIFGLAMGALFGPMVVWEMNRYIDPHIIRPPGVSPSYITVRINIHVRDRLSHPIPHAYALEATPGVPEAALDPMPYPSDKRGVIGWWAGWSINRTRIFCYKICADGYVPSYFNVSLYGDPALNELPFALNYVVILTEVEP